MWDRPSASSRAEGGSPQCTPFWSPYPRGKHFPGFCCHQSGLPVLGLDATGIIQCVFHSMNTAQVVFFCWLDIGIVSSVGLFWITLLWTFLCLLGEHMWQASVRDIGMNWWVVGCLYQKRQWHPTPVLLPGESHGWRSLVGYSTWGSKESDTTERLHLF